MTPANAQLLLLVLLVLVYVLFVVRPQRNRIRALRQVQTSLTPGREVITSAGLIGRVAAVEDDVVVLEVAAGVRVRFATAAVVRFLDEPAPSAKTL